MILKLQRQESIGNLKCPRSRRVKSQTVAAITNFPNPISIVDKDAFMKDRLNIEYEKKYKTAMPRQKLLAMYASNKNVMLASTQRKLNIFQSSLSYILFAYT